MGFLGSENLRKSHEYRFRQLQNSWTSLLPNSLVDNTDVNESVLEGRLRGHLVALLGPRDLASEHSCHALDHLPVRDLLVQGRQDSRLWIMVGLARTPGTILGGARSSLGVGGHKEGELAGVVWELGLVNQPLELGVQRLGEP